MSKECGGIRVGLVEASGQTTVHVGNSHQTSSHRQVVERDVNGNIANFYQVNNYFYGACPDSDAKAILSIPQSQARKVEEPGSRAAVDLEPESPAERATLLARPYSGAATRELQATPDRQRWIYSERLQCRYYLDEQTNLYITEDGRRLPAATPERLLNPRKIVAISNESGSERQQAGAPDRDPADVRSGRLASRQASNAMSRRRVDSTPSQADLLQEGYTAAEVNALQTLIHEGKSPVAARLIIRLLRAGLPPADAKAISRDVEAGCDLSEAIRRVRAKAVTSGEA